MKLGEISTGSSLSIGADQGHVIKGTLKEKISDPCQETFTTTNSLMDRLILGFLGGHRTCDMGYR